MSECPTCGDTFANENGMKVHHFHAHNESIAGVDIVCDYCGKETHKRQKKKRNDHEFCSRECSSKWMSENLSGENSHLWEGRTIQVACDWCDSQVEKKAINIERNEHKFCDRECNAKWQEENRCGENNHFFNPELTVECDWCGKKHQKNSWKLKRNNKNFCGNECRGKWQSETRCGKNHPRWVEDDTRIPYGGSWKAKRKARLEKDDHQCVVCSKTNAQEKVENGRGLDVHHIKKAKHFLQEDGTLNEEKAHRLENLITLCRTCHRRWEGIPLRPVTN